eukprot:TRINITY_DN12223_c0_g1_i1.p2 TRINITY_DN12223_c0_g1~~TRINITY_DN12223_c0_g1_i1.p2  ORF type:complete len:181 (-),score=28.15 TRINITY_DN12223_c0_g1_i1:351-893(-)
MSGLLISGGLLGFLELVLEALYGLLESCHLRQMLDCSFVHSAGTPTTCCNQLALMLLRQFLFAERNSLEHSLLLVCFGLCPDASSCFQRSCSHGMLLGGKGLLFRLLQPFIGCSPLVLPCLLQLLFQHVLKSHALSDLGLLNGSSVLVAKKLDVSLVLRNNFVNSSFSLLYCALSRLGAA